MVTDSAELRWLPPVCYAGSLGFEWARLLDFVVKSEELRHFLYFSQFPVDVLARQRLHGSSFEYERDGQMHRKNMKIFR